MRELFESYKKGIDHLLDEIGTDHSDYDKVLDQRTRLFENLDNEERFGDNPQLRSERGEILHNLDSLARNSLGKPFHELYEAKDKLASHKSSSKEPFSDTSRNIQQSRQVKPSPILTKHFNKDTIAKIEQMMDTMSRLQLTSTAVQSAADVVNDTITWLRSSAADREVFSYGKVAVMNYLRDARKFFSVAVQEYTRRGSSQKFFDLIERGRLSLERALQAW